MQCSPTKNKTLTLTLKGKSGGLGNMLSVIIFNILLILKWKSGWWLPNMVVPQLNSQSATYLSNNNIVIIELGWATRPQSMDIYLNLSQL